MKSISIIVFLTIVITLAIVSQNQAQYNAPDIKGIQLISYDSDWIGWTEEDYKTMKDSIGVDILISTNLTSADLQRKNISTEGMYTIPNQIEAQQNPEIKHWIYYYSEGRYTVWEAEGTALQDGDASIYYKESIGTFFQEGPINGIVTNDYAEYDTLIYGPLYTQEVRYAAAEPGVIDYRVEYKLKLSNTIPIQGNPQLLPSDEICILQVTVSEFYIDTNVNPHKWVKETTPIQEVLLKRENFNLNNWQIETINYRLDELESKYYKIINSTKGEIKFAHYVEFKIIWLGDPNSKLYVDNIVVSDERGRAIQLPSIQERIIEQDNADYIAGNYEEFIKAWLGRDEPESIDMFEPVRIISNVLNDNNQGERPLVMNLSVSWNGRFGDEIPWKNSNYVVKSEEFVKRTKNTHIWQNSYMFDSPFKENGTFWWLDDYKDWNIRILGDSILSRINKVDSLFGQLIMCGRFWEDAMGNVQFREILPHELSYSVNLSLLYGAKSLVLFGYFGYDEDHTGLVNWNWGAKSKTDKFYHMKNVISPSLKGSFGKTLRNIWQTEQFLNINASENYNFISHFSGNLECLPSTAKYELGFFTDELQRDYFMILSRWYNHGGVCPIYAHLDKDYFGFNNLSVTKYVADTTYSVINDDVTLKIQLIPGETELLRIVPVVKYGGNLISDETVPSGTTLHDDMTIGESATLTINGTYIAKANITLKSGGKIVPGQNGKIVFDPGKGIIIDGNAEIKGASNNRLTLEFDNSTPVGVYVPSGRSLNISYCDVKKAQVGLKADPGSGIDIYYVNFSDCQNTGIALFGFGNGDNQSTQTPYIYKCNITNSGTGISVIDAYEIVIKENNISQCNLGIYLYMVNSAYVSKNNIIGNALPNGSPLPSLYMHSSGGYLRNNILKQHSYGVHLVSSSPDMGVNTIENNTVCGLYVDLGSYPNLVKRLVNPSCWYPIGGCNSIMNNGVYVGVPPQSLGQSPLGAEIFLSNSDVQLRNGENEISDDREGLPEILTLPLIKGTRGSGDGQRALFVDYNYWGVVGPSQNRFGSLNVVYDPTSDFCILPAAPCSGDNEIVIQTSDGRIVDTLESRQRESAELSDLEELYAMADKLFYSGDIEDAQAVYQQIINGQYSNEEKLYAYKKLYDIGEILREDDQYFITLQNALNSILAVETDTLLLKAFGQRSILCDVSRQEYISAIEKFDNIIQQNPNSTEAVYAEIDILTTALYLDTTNSQLGKMNGGKYLVKGTSDYLTRVNDLLNSKFGINKTESETIVPKEYVLYQNYPNPFNPTTTIKFDLPKDGVVELGVYDILGRKITTLINEYRNAGSYEHNFNASSIASGIYLYRIKVNDFVSAKKMILVK